MRKLVKLFLGRTRYLLRGRVKVLSLSTVCDVCWSASHGHIQNGTVSTWLLSYLNMSSFLLGSGNLKILRKYAIPVFHSLMPQCSKIHTTLQGKLDSKRGMGYRREKLGSRDTTMLPSTEPL